MPKNIECCTQNKNNIKKAGKKFWVEGFRTNLADERIGSCCLACRTKLWRRARMPRQLELVFFKNFGQTVALVLVFFILLSERKPTIVSVLLPVPCAACARSVACESRCALPATRVRVMPATAAEHSLHIHRLFVFGIIIFFVVARRRNLALERPHPTLQCGFLLLASSSVHLHNGGVLASCSSLLHS